MMKVLVFITTLVIVLDIASNIVLFWSEFQTSSTEIPYKTPGTCFENYFSCFAFWKVYSLDMLSLLVLRLLLNLVAMVLAVKLGTVNPATTTTPTTCSSSNGNKIKNSIQTPLLGVTILDQNSMSEKNGEEKEKFVSLDGEELVRGVLGVEGRKNASKVAKQKLVLDQKSAATFRKNMCLVFAFFANTAVSMYIGIKVVVFAFSDKQILLQAVMLGTSPVWINLEFMLFRWIVEECTKVKGHMFKGIHHHPLFLKTMAYNWCDLCHQKIEDRQGYRCDLCDFDVCNACASKKDRSRAEGVLRGDDGVREEKEVTSCQYFCRSLKLIAPHSGIIMISMAALLVNSGTAIWIPNYTGKILDSVVHSKLSLFWDNIKFYSVLCVITGLFGAVRNLCVNVVGRRIARDVRQQLFGAIMVQDVAFFDGMPTGQLTSRLTQDTYAMVSPLNTILNSLVSNVLLLFGGLVMCLYTSWRLSLLAFTSIGPIIYVTSVYAKWSRGINHQIWSALGNANSIATEAISNVKTVRAFGRELGEIFRFNESINMALSKGIKDAIAGAGTYAITNYIDLGAGILILSYGGAVAIDHPDRLSVGKLITFQLYWNMINSAYQSLNGVISSLTRAGGAATRVISLLESLPDIDPTLGLDLNVDTMNGELILKDVHFHYQMRPDNKVLRGISLHIKKGTVVALVGRSGSGKSTIINLLQRFYNPTIGSISLDGVNVKDIKPLSLRKVIASVHQETQLFNRTIEENIT
jgi:ABC-type multidrug transport system fused ATPase/permease subunit